DSHQKRNVRIGPRNAVFIRHHVADGLLWFYRQDAFPYALRQRGRSRSRFSQKIDFRRRKDALAEWNVEFRPCWTAREVARVCGNSHNREFGRVTAGYNGTQSLFQGSCIAPEQASHSFVDDGHTPATFPVCRVEGSSLAYWNR